MAITYQHNDGKSYEEWLFNRKESVGSSEVGPIILGNKWTCNLEIFYWKLAGHPLLDESFRAWLGKKTESVNQESWEYYDGTDGSIPRNYNAGKKVKKGVNRKVTVFNSKYPGRSSTPDVFILPYGVYEHKKGEGVCELKNTQQMILDTYEAGIPTDNLFQICDQMMLTDLHYGELSYFLDNRTMKVFPMEENKQVRNMQSTIKHHVGLFWENVLKAKPLYHQMHTARLERDNMLADQIAVEIQKLEPPPQNTVGYLNYLTTRYKAKISGEGIMKGSDADYMMAVKWNDLSSKIKKLEKEKRAIEISFKNILQEKTCIDFGQRGQVTWNPDKNQTRRFNVSIK